jgi:hypothetical protein
MKSPHLKSQMSSNYILGRRVGGSEGISAVACKIGKILVTVPDIQQNLSKNCMMMILYTFKYLVNNVVVLKLKPSTGSPFVRDAFSCFLT